MMLQSLTWKLTGINHNYWRRRCSQVLLLFEIWATIAVALHFTLLSKLFDVQLQIDNGFRLIVRALLIGINGILRDNSSHIQRSILLLSWGRGIAVLILKDEIVYLFTLIRVNTKASSTLKSSCALGKTRTFSFFLNFQDKRWARICACISSSVVRWRVFDLIGVFIAKDTRRHDGLFEVGLPIRR